jgi:acetyl esterase/lipase
MKNVICLFVFLVAALLSSAQTAGDLYKKADSLYKLKEYKSSAMAYTDGIKIDGRMLVPLRYLRAANSWAMAAMPDSAFHTLNQLANSNNISFSIARGIENSKDLTSLQTDKRWQPLLAQAYKKAESNFPQEEIIYGRKDGTALSMIHLKPTGKPNGKAVMCIVAGSWYSSYNDAENYVSGSANYIEKGYTVFLVVVGSQPRFSIPDQIADAKRAVRYVRYNAKKLKIDPDHIGMVGYSAGGHLTLAVATADDKIDTTSNDPIDRVSSRVQAVAVLFPPTDFLNWGHLGNIVNAPVLLKSNQIYGALDFKTWNNATSTYNEVSDTSARNKIGKEISPIYAVSSDDPPVFIIHGDADMTVPLQQSQSIIAKFNEAGVTNRFVIKKGKKHNAYDMNPEWQEFADWFDKYLK